LYRYFRDDLKTHGEVDIPGPRTLDKIDFPPQKSEAVKGKLPGIGLQDEQNIHLNLFSVKHEGQGGRLQMVGTNSKSQDIFIESNLSDVQEFVNHSTGIHYFAEIQLLRPEHE
jgi:hypothetical protein